MRLIDKAITTALDRGDESEAAFLRGLRTADGVVKVFSVPGREVVAYCVRTLRHKSGRSLTIAKPVWSRRRGRAASTHS